MANIPMPRTENRASPLQVRSNKTVEQILRATSELLGEVGFEKLSTNGICARAGLTPPALYRYFPNKYAVLKTLGERLMDKQNALLEKWAQNEFNPHTLEAEIFEHLKLTLDVTRAEPAGEWIMRSLHASPVLSNVRLQSHRHVTKLLVARVMHFDPKLDEAMIYDRVRLGIEMSYATIEMIFDETELDETSVLENASSLLAQNIKLALNSRGKNKSRASKRGNLRGAKRTMLHSKQPIERP
ncbi:MAG: TetR/AcrR family transcriptional regulator [Robiginitomaculum sp.]|nr:TetR/AcrR family transcriptional regulator [Robiginitomaculum sp.]MDQ7078191.1 TetR/AcrR family transcriptional regulator [Robiginitomaculum sp.]